MRECRKFRVQFPEYLFGELSPNKLLKFNNHIFRCTQCREELSAMQNVIGLIRTELDEITVPPEFDWQKFHTTLSSRLVQKPQLDYLRLFIQWLKSNLIPQPTWATSLSCAVTIIFLVFQGANITKSYANSTDMPKVETKYNNAFENRVNETKYVYDTTNSLGG